MKSLTSALLGATALTMAAFGAVEPAQARAEFGVYAGGLRVDVNYRGCGDYWYRRNHPYYCNRYDGSYYSYPNYNFRFYDNDDWRYRRHHRDRDWDDRRDGGEGGHRHHHHHDGGERGW